MSQPTTDNTGSVGEGARGVYKHDSDRVKAGSLGLFLLLITLGMLFGGLVLVVLAVRVGDEAWPANLPHLPWQVWVSTASLLATSIAFAEAVAAMRRGSDAGIRLALGTAGIMVILFTGMQGWAWLDWYEQMPAVEAATQQHRVGVMGFWVFTGLHGMHVLGGLIPLGMVAWYALFRTWTASRHGLLRHTAIYWHFLDAVWVVLLLTMLVIL
jgi:heme/copper-type cytochrome/quinol oxidase subunit 3